MWISIFALTFAIALGCCVAAIVMQPKRMRARWEDAFIRQTPPASPLQSPDLSAQEFAEGEHAPVSSCLGERLRRHYRPVLDESIPAHLKALIERL